MKLEIKLNFLIFMIIEETITRFNRHFINIDITFDKCIDQLN